VCYDGAVVCTGVQDKVLNLLLSSFKQFKSLLFDFTSSFLPLSHISIFSPKEKCDEMRYERAAEIRTRLAIVFDGLHRGLASHPLRRKSRTEGRVDGKNQLLVSVSVNQSR